MATAPRKPKPQPSRTALDRAFDALAHPTRRAIILVLYARGGSMPAGLIADRFKHAWPTITRHLRELEEAGLVAVEQHGRQRLYRLVAANLEPVRDWVTTVAAPNPQQGGEDPTHWTNLPFGAMRNTMPPNG